MVQLSKTLLFLTAAVVALTTQQTAVVSAHPGVPHEASAHGLEARRLFAANAKLAYEGCKNAAHMRQLEDRTATRRLATLTELREQQQRDYPDRRRLTAVDVLAKSHKSSAKVLFGSTPKCLLQPDVAQGPYYVRGELVRNDIRETQHGIDLYTEIQVIDVNTCKPVPEMYLDFWHANATGVYSGVVAKGNGDSNDKANIYSTFARGLAATDRDGVVQFISKFPGHYAGRASHIHIMGNSGGKLLANKTYVGSHAVSIGQLFFDQELIAQVEKAEVYAANKAAITLNTADALLAQAAASGFDPIVQYAYLGSTVEDGVFAWISIGVNMTATKTVEEAGTWAAGTGSGRGGHGHGHGPATAGSNGSFVDEHETTDDFVPGSRNPLFSITFFFLATTTLVVMLRKYPVRSQPQQQKYGAAMESA